MLSGRAAEARLTKPFSPHDFRRTFISDLLDQGVDPATVQALAGRADIKTTVKYDRRGERAVDVIHVPYFAPAPADAPSPKRRRS